MPRRHQTKPLLLAGLYAVTAERLSRGRTNIQVVQAIIAGGAKIVQYREKRPHKSHIQMLEECRQIRRMTRDAGVVFIVNDHVDLAMLVDADGVHVGQDDLPVPEVRKLVGAGKIIGLSTHAPKQAQQALSQGADYIGVGPIFSTRTKTNVCELVGTDYIDHVVREIALPFVAIGGIKEHNVGQVVRHGAKTVCLISEIVGAENITETVKRINAAILSQG